MTFERSTYFDRTAEHWLKDYFLQYVVHKADNDLRAYYDLSNAACTGRAMLRTYTGDELGNAYITSILHGATDWLKEDVYIAGVYPLSRHTTSKAEESGFKISYEDII